MYGSTVAMGQDVISVSRGRFSSACLIQVPRLCKFVLIEAIDNSYVSQMKVPVCRTNSAEKTEFRYSSFTVKNHDDFKRNCYEPFKMTYYYLAALPSVLPCLTYRRREECQLAGLAFTSPCMNKASCALSGPLFFSFLLPPAVLLGVLAPLGAR
jgi:hypothetical protein